MITLPNPSAKFFKFLFLFSFFIHGQAQTLHRCFGANFTQNSTYESTLNLLLSTLSTNAPGTNGFLNSSAGRTADDTVYAVFQCRGDTTCRNCVMEATTNIAHQFCPFSKGAVVWFDDCLLHYSDQIFFSVVSTVPSYGLKNPADIGVDTPRFNQLAMSTMAAAAGEASARVMGQMFATQEAIFTSNTTLYALAQCTADLSNSNCEECLTRAIRGIPRCCNNKRGGCYVRYEIYPFYQLTMTNFSPPPPPTVRRESKSSKSSAVVIVAIVAPITVSILLFVLGWCFLRRRGKKKYTAEKEDSVVNEITTEESLQFDFKTIDAATNNFSEENKLGEGGFGAVYRGRLDNGQEIAVKRLSSGSMQGSEEFKNEAMLVAKLQHRNLVRLLGFCFEGGEKILIYEYIPNKSLDYFLFDTEGRRVLDWLAWYKIIIGIARGMLYLHEDSRLRIIHRDFKASNILLDEDMNPKILDFGIAKIIQVDQTQGNTSRTVGTYGYMSPEYAMQGKFSMKSDVYSFGVLVWRL